MEKWNEYFSGLLGGVKERVVGREGRLGEENNSKKGLKKEEVAEAIKSMR